MKMQLLTEEELWPLIQDLTENRSREFKSPFDWGDHKSRKIKEETIKAIMAMANTPSGGVVVLGISEDNKKKKIVTGATSNQIEWIEKNYESVENDINKYCSEYPDIKFATGKTNKLPDKKLTPFIVIFVSEFTHRPMICKRTGDEIDSNGKKILIEGDIYGRSYSGGWASKKCSSKELDEVIKLATDKSQRDLEIRGYIKIDQVKDLMEKLKKERSDYE